MTFFRPTFDWIGSSRKCESLLPDECTRSSQPAALSRRKAVDVGLHIPLD